ncbi:MAG: thioether cross-link-forming SCIFF peptide maturase [Clostridiales bacterium]|jgi:uncharacterized protein|nr:thioether cross-link-forming SCIFF peptide maturase [Clostridiales bacterium]
MIHKFKAAGHFFVLDVNSSSLHIVDELANDLLDFYPDGAGGVSELSAKYPEADLREAAGEIDALVSNGLLFSSDPFEGAEGSAFAEPVVKALCLHLAHDCNLRCRYCFAGTGGFGGGRSLMPAETGRAAVDFLLTNSGSRRNLEVDFFGGEPLMNFEAMKAIVAHARENEGRFGKKISFTVTTNGLLLDDEKTAYINEHTQNAVLSLDGRPAVNDAMRPAASGGGSYVLVAPKFQKLIERRAADYYARGTYTRENLDFTADILHLRDLGFRCISMEPVVLPPESPLSIRTEDLPAIYSEYDKLLDIMLLDDSFSFFHYNVDLTGGPCVYKRLSGCGAGSQYLAVVPNGDFYACHQLAGDPSYLCGNVKTGLTSRFETPSVNSRPKCRACFAKFFCGGGCPAAAITLNGGVSEPYEIGCALQKKRTECALALNALKAR